MQQMGGDILEQKKETLLELNHVSVRYQDTSEPVLQEIGSGCQTGGDHLRDRRERLRESTLLQSILCLPGRVKVTREMCCFRGKICMD